MRAIDKSCDYDRGIAATGEQYRSWTMMNLQIRLAPFSLLAALLVGIPMSEGAQAQSGDGVGNIVVAQSVVDGNRQRQLRRKQRRAKKKAARAERRELRAQIRTVRRAQRRANKQVRKARRAEARQARRARRQANRRPRRRMRQQVARQSLRRARQRQARRSPTAAIRSTRQRSASSQRRTARAQRALQQRRAGARRAASTRTARVQPATRTTRSERRRARRAASSRREGGRRDATPRNILSVRSARRQRRDRGRLIIEEPDSRRIVRAGRRTIIRSNDSRRLRRWGRRSKESRRGGLYVTTVYRRNGVRIITERDRWGHLVRRYRRGHNGRIIVLINNRPRYARRHYHDDYHPERFHLGLAMPVITLAATKYIVDASYASTDVLYDTFEAPPVIPISRSYTLDEIRYNRPLRAHMRSVNLTMVNFDTGSWYIDDYSHERLAAVAEAMHRVLRRNPQEVFLIEGHTDAVGTDDDNLSLSDRRAESVAVALTEEFGIPAENLVTQGYGEQHLYVPTLGPDRRNRRVVVRRITPLLSQGY